jgi:hypothetical protein
LRDADRSGVARGDVTKKDRIAVSRALRVCGWLPRARSN